MRTLGASICFAVCLAAPLAVPRAQQTAPASEVGIARERMIECARREIPKLDDGITSAEVVGRIAAKACAREVDLLYLAATSAMHPDVRRGFDRSWDPPGLFTAFVLTRRTAPK